VISLAAIEALEEAGALVDKQAAPLRWAEIHEPLAALLLEHGKLERADELISDVIDLREEHQGESHPDLARSLMLWMKLLYARAKYSGAASVAARAGRIYAGQNPPELLGFASALNARAVALQKSNQAAEAEPLYRRALAIAEQSDEPEVPELAAYLNNLAELLAATNRPAEAEPLYCRALAVAERNYGPDHPDVARDLNNLAVLLHTTSPHIS
jgi:tetratricopeptide (TPR) repeat protein